MPPNKVAKAHRHHGGLREALFDLIQKGEDKARRHLDDKPDELRGVLEALETVREVVSRLLASPKKLTRLARKKLTLLVHDLTVGVAHYGQGDLKDEEAGKRDRALLLEAAQEARDKANLIRGDSGLYLN